MNSVHYEHKKTSGHTHFKFDVKMRLIPLNLGQAHCEVIYQIYVSFSVLYQSFFEREKKTEGSSRPRLSIYAQN